MFDFNWWRVTILYAVSGFLNSSAFLWFFVSLCVLGFIGIVLVIVCIAKLSRRKSNYVKIPPLGNGHEGDEIHTAPEYVMELKEAQEGQHATTPSQIRISSGKKVNISKFTDTNAEVSFSDLDPETIPTDGNKGSGVLSAYGDAVSPMETRPTSGRTSLRVPNGGSASGDTASVASSLVSIDSKASWFKSDANYDLNVQLSLMYSKDMRYVAGKVIHVNGLTFDSKGAPTYARVHVVALPLRKYALKTNWYKIPIDGKLKIGEYFKFVFKLPPSESNTMFRVRIYVGKSHLGSLGRGSCMGECYITLLEIIDARGGLVVSRSMARGIPQSILQGQIS